MTTPGYTTYHNELSEDVVPTRRLGRHVRHDSRSLQYPWQQTGAALKDTLLTRRIGILDQGNVGSCTGNAETGALGTDPLYSTLSAEQQGQLDEKLALALYSAAETIDGDGPYPPQDNGSSGLSVCQAAKNAGWISGYVHCLSLNDVLDAISAGHAVIIGSNWYTSMDTPDSNGLVTITADATVRGGHEYLARGIDVENKLIHLDNSWGTSWGVQGSFTYSWDTLTRLLSEQGDGTVSVPLTQPAPTPQPAPPTPTPAPVPPQPDPGLLAELAQLVRDVAGTAEQDITELLAWLASKNL